MVKRQAFDFMKTAFVVAAFDMKPACPIPTRREDLAKSYFDGNGTWFHGLVCPRCHLVPNWRSWLNQAPRG